MHLIFVPTIWLCRGWTNYTCTYTCHHIMTCWSCHQSLMWNVYCSDFRCHDNCIFYPYLALYKYVHVHVLYAFKPVHNVHVHVRIHVLMYKEYPHCLLLNVESADGRGLWNTLSRIWHRRKRRRFSSIEDGVYLDELGSEGIDAADFFPHRTFK